MFITDVQDSTVRSRSAGLIFIPFFPIQWTQMSFAIQGILNEEADSDTVQNTVCMNMQVCRTPRSNQVTPWWLAHKLHPLHVKHHTKTRQQIYFCQRRCSGVCLGFSQSNNVMINPNEEDRRADPNAVQNLITDKTNRENKTR